MYWDLNPHLIYKILKERLGDLAFFRENIVSYLENLERK